MIWTEWISSVMIKRLKEEGNEKRGVKRSEVKISEVKRSEVK